MTLEHIYTRSQQLAGHSEFDRELMIGEIPVLCKTLAYLFQEEPRIADGRKSRAFNDQFHDGPEPTWAVREKRSGKGSMHSS